MNSYQQILIAEASSFSEAGKKAFARLGATDACDCTQEQLVDKIGGYTILVLRLGLRVNEAVFASATKLRFIASPTTGLDHIDLDAAQRYGVEVISLKGERAFLDQVFATAEHTMALLLALARRLPAAFLSVQNYSWRRDLYRGTELNGKKFGIVGCGRLGTMAARYAQGFGMQVYAYDPYINEFPSGVEPVVTLTELLETCDILSLHVPLNAETSNMIGEAELNRMHPGALIINTARGGVLDEAALLAALKNGNLGGAALDVLQDEAAIISGSLRELIEYARTHNNLIITPHIGGATFESVEKADLFIAARLAERLLIIPSHPTN